jgi:DNA polymerase-1
MSADYSQIEMRIMAHLSGDDGLIEAFRSGEDLHRFVGSRVFGVEPADVTAEMRSKVKAMSYGLAYGLSAFGLSRSWGSPPRRPRASWTSTSSGSAGCATTCAMSSPRPGGYGVHRDDARAPALLPDLTSDNRQRREMAERMALNAPIQGSAADIMKVAMLGSTGAAGAGAASRMLLQVHDELVIEVAPGERDRSRSWSAARWAQRCPHVPLDVSASASAGPGTTPRTEARRATGLERPRGRAASSASWGGAGVAARAVTPAGPARRRG